MRRLEWARSRGFDRVVLAGVVLSLLALPACSAPDDAGRTRPDAVSRTPYAEKDLLLGGADLIRVRMIDVPAKQIPESPARPLLGTPTVLLIPGHTSRVEEFDDLVPTLSRHRRVVSLDFPGSGYSEKPERDYDLAYYETVALAFLDELGIEQVDVVGGSLGGNLALRLAHRAPARFRRVAIWAPGSAWDAHRGWAAALRTVGRYPLFWPTVRIQSRYWYSDDWPGRADALADTFAYYEEVMGPGFVRMYFGIAADQVARSLFDLAPEIQHPVWLGWGDRDDGADMGEGVARLHALLPRSELTVFRDARHSLSAEVPTALGTTIDEFLARPAEALP